MEYADTVQAHVNLVQAYFDYDYGDSSVIFAEYPNMSPANRRDIASGFTISKEIMSMMKNPLNYKKDINQFIDDLTIIYNNKLNECHQEVNEAYYEKALEMLDDLYWFVNGVPNPKTLEVEDDLP